MTIGGRRIATATGAMLADPAYLGNPLPADASAFEPAYWASHGRIEPVRGGRGAAWFIAADGASWVLRHYRRGGWVARFSKDFYLWCGESRVRAFAEWRLLSELAGRGLPVPVPIAAAYHRNGAGYRCDLLMQRIADTRTLSALLAASSVSQSAWRAVGSTIAAVHLAGVDHADLNAHNVLLRSDGKVFLIDFDRGRLRAPGAWVARNLKRLRRSLQKSSGTNPERFSQLQWQWLLDGYAGHAPAV